MSWKSHNQERSVDVPVAKTAAQPRRTPGRRVKKNPCVLAANTERKSDLDTFRYWQAALVLFVRQVLHIQVFREERVTFSCGETHNVDPQATPPNNAAHNGHIPLLRLLTRLHVIVGNGNDCPVVQDGDKDHCHHRKRNTLEFGGHRPAPGFCPKSLYRP